jgi:hypothetical protein
MVRLEPRRRLERLQRVRQLVGVVTRVAEVIERGGICGIELGCPTEWLDGAAPARSTTELDPLGGQRLGLRGTLELRGCAGGGL